MKQYWFNADDDIARYTKNKCKTYLRQGRHRLCMPVCFGEYVLPAGHAVFSIVRVYE